MPRLTLLLLSSAALLSGCVIESGPARSRVAEPVFKSIDESEEPGGIFSVMPAKENRILCPHCGASNRLGQTHCSACKKRLSLRPLWAICDACGGSAKSADDKPCPACGGSGWVHVEEE